MRAALLGEPAPRLPDAGQRWQIVHEHLMRLAAHHGTLTASKLARKHVLWYSKGVHGAAEFRRKFQVLQDWQAQLALAESFFSGAPQQWLHAA